MRLAKNGLLILRGIKRLRIARSSSHERNREVGNALSEQFHIGVMLIAAHAICDYGRKKAFDGSQHGYGNCGGQQRDNQIGSNVW